MDIGMNDPKITVVINTYNHSQYIGRAIHSVLAQTFRPWEIIVVDDGSTDGTADEVRREFGDQVRYWYHANSGISNSRNVGIQLSSGSWIAFLDSDDFWMPEKLASQVEAIKSKPTVAMVVCDGVECTPDGSVLDELRLPYPLTRDVIRSRLRSRCTFTTSAVVIQRDVLIQAGGFPADLMFGEDWVTFARIAASYEIVAVHRPLFSKTQLQEGLSSQPQLALRDGLICLKRCKQALASHKWPQSWQDGVVFRQSEAQLFLHTAWIYGKRRERSKAISTLLKGLVRWPFLTFRQYRSIYWLWTQLLRRNTA
jgi:glycosyltransferase involved in cell wall biosynthesis